MRIISWGIPNKSIGNKQGSLLINMTWLSRKYAKTEFLDFSRMASDIVLFLFC